MLPDAFVFGYAGDNGNMLKLNFRTNPDFHPPSMEARVFHYMEGEMWVDCKQRERYWHTEKPGRERKELVGHH